MIIIYLINHSTSKLFIEFYSYRKIQRKNVKWNLKEMFSETTSRHAVYRL